MRNLCIGRISILIISMALIGTNSCTNGKCKKYPTVAANKIVVFDSFSVHIYLPDNFLAEKRDSYFANGIIFEHHKFKNGSDTNFEVIVGRQIRPASYPLHSVSFLPEELKKMYWHVAPPLQGDMDYGFLDTINEWPYIHTREYINQTNRREDRLQSFFHTRYFDVSIIHNAYRNSDTAYFNKLSDTIISSVDIKPNAK